MNQKPKGVHIMKGLQAKGIARRNKMLYAAVQLFLENGYEGTTTSQISKAAGMSATSFFAAFENKEALLLALVKVMFTGQFEQAKAFANTDDPVLMYCIETALQIHITELSESLREVYVKAYSLPSTSEYIYRSTAKQLKAIFGSYMGDADDKDYYEMDIASSSIMRGFMARPCDVYFTVDLKLKRFLDCCLKLYNVPEEKRKEMTQKVLSIDLATIARKLIEEVVKRAEKGFEQAMGSK